MEPKIFYINRIQEAFDHKKRLNPQYSLRAYARDLGIHSSTLSKILNGKRALPLKNATIVANRLKLTAKDRSLFMKSIVRFRVNKAVELSLGMLKQK